LEEEFIFKPLDPIQIYDKIFLHTVQINEIQSQFLMMKDSKVSFAIPVLYN